MLQDTHTHTHMGIFESSSIFFVVLYGIERVSLPARANVSYELWSWAAYD